VVDVHFGVGVKNLGLDQDSPNILDPDLNFNEYASAALPTTNIQKNYIRCSFQWKAA
jgi:hypothetical protein